MGIFGIKILSQTKTRMHAHTHTHTQKRNSAFIQFACCIFKFSSVVIFTFARQHLTVMLDDGTAILRCTGTHVYTHMYCVFKELCVWLKCIMWKNIHDMMHKSFIPTEQYVSANQQLSSCFSCFVLFLFFCNPHLFFFCCCDYDIMKIYLLTQKRYRLLYPSVILWLPKATESFEAISYLHVAFMSNISDSKKHNVTQVLSHQPTIRGDIEMLWSFRHERLIQKAAGLVRLNWIFFLYRVINLSDNYCLLLFLRFFIVLIWTAQPPAHISKWQQKVIKYIYRTKLRLFTRWAWCDDCFFL